MENNPLKYVDPSGHVKASDNEHLAGLVQGYTDKWNRAQDTISSLQHTLNTCFTVTLCQQAQSVLTTINYYKSLQSGYEREADAVRVGYYQLHGLSIPNDIKYKTSSVGASNVTNQLNSLMSEFNEDYKD